MSCGINLVGFSEQSLLGKVDIACSVGLQNAEQVEVGELWHRGVVC